MRVRFTRGVANTPAGAERNVSSGAADRLVRAGEAVYVGSVTETASIAPLPAEPAVPAPSDHKAAWVDYAATSGYTVDAAKAMTKRELIDALS